MRLIVASAGLAGLLVLAAAGCAAPVETAKGPPPPPPTIAPATSPEAPAVTQPPAASPIAPTPAGAVVEDPTLLAVLPADVAGVPVTHEALAFTEAATDPAFAGNVEAAAFAVAVDGADLASAVVARLNPGVYSEAFFRDWRDTYDEGACGQAGGVVGNAETQLGEQAVYIGTCAEGLRTYHAWLADRGVVVSAFSLGDRRFGELLMAGLRP